MPYQTLTLLVTAVLQLMVGGYVFSRNPRGPVHRAVLVETTLIALWCLFIASTWLVSSTEQLVVCGRWAHVASLLGTAGFLALCLVYPAGRRRVSPALMSVVWITGCIVSAAAVLTPDLLDHAVMQRGQLIAQYGSLRYAYFGYFTLCMVWGLTDLGLRMKRTHGVHRGQIEYLAAGLGLSGILAVPPNVILPWLGYHSFVWIGATCSLVWVAFIAHAIVRHRLMGIRVFVARWVTRLLAALIAGILFVAVLGILSSLVARAGHSLSAAAALVVAILFQPIQTVVWKGVSRYFYRPEYDYQKTLRDASRALAETLDLDTAMEYLLTTVSRTLQVEHAQVLIHDRLAGDFRTHTPRRPWAVPDGPAAAVLAEKGPLVTCLREMGESVVREELEQRPDAEALAAVIDEMARLGADVAVPLSSGSRLRGVLLVGPKISGDFFTAQDVDLLSTLGSEAATAVANAQLHQEALQADRLATLGGLAAGIAHEVKNPLVAVRTFAELLPERHADPEFREGFSELVLRELERVEQLIGQLLSYARPKPPRLERICVNDVIAETLDFLAYELSRQGVRVETRYAADLPVVQADPQQLRQVVLNIALNAVQVMAEGGVLRVTTRKAGGGLYPVWGGERVEIEIANTGPPIPEADRDRIFEPFYTTRGGGTGLGLPICKRIIAEHRGDIRVGTTREGWTAFVIWLPAESGEAALTAAATPNVSARADEAQRGVGVIG